MKGCENQGERVVIEVPMSFWHRVNGCVDNSIAVDVQSCEGAADETSKHGNRVMQAGWEAATAHPTTVQTSSWPPDDALLTVGLSHADWAWALSQLERWAVYETDLIEAIEFLRNAIQHTS
ncbi:hypothetical protein [Microbacterium sp. YY-01]|uniref:hypothetical protein n=1 Tax=Microbacterium sp. YY-01 TaxID=3421634 RepID=UPI003D16B0C3